MRCTDTFADEYAAKVGAVAITKAQDQINQALIYLRGSHDERAKAAVRELQQPARA